MEWTVYVCSDCGAWHRQLFLIEHDDDCNDGSDWFVTTKSRPTPLGATDGL
jgi:hypothetical protein